MDFSISELGETDYPPVYPKIKEIGGWQLKWQPSGNLEELNSQQSSALIIGSMFGSLRQSSGLTTGDPRTLGCDALDSNGSFAIVIPREQEIVVVTDAGGSIPICYGDGPRGIAVGTRVHEVARQSGLETLDKVSAVDFLMHSTICYPYTWFEDVRFLPPGSVCTIGPEGMTAHTFWQPEEPDDIYESCDVAEWGKRLREEVSMVLKNSVKDEDKVRVLFSGGEDSRAVASLVPEEVECILTTVLDSKNREYRWAARAAKALGRPIEWISRPKGYYRSDIKERINTIGPGWDFRHLHFFGDLSNHFQDADVLLGGYLADTFFKTYHMANVEQEQGLTPDSLGKPMPDDIDVLRKGEKGSKWFSTDLVVEVRERRGDHHQVLKEIRPMTAGNWHALWPISNAPHFAQYLGEHRIGPRIVEPFLFSQVYRLAAEMPDEGRIDTRVFRRAFANSMGLAGWLPKGSSSVPLLGGCMGQVASFVLVKGREIKDALTRSESVKGSWTPDHNGWSPVHPANHFTETAQARMEKHLRTILAGGEVSAFLRSDAVDDNAKVRSLCLALDSEFLGG
jgi:asparagine synthetase B (glutamine-hydrolysing)